MEEKCAAMGAPTASIGYREEEEDIVVKGANQGTMEKDKKS